jgi:hypothetical protein
LFGADLNLLFRLFVVYRLEIVSDWRIYPLKYLQRVVSVATVAYLICLRVNGSSAIEMESLKARLENATPKR